MHTTLPGGSGRGQNFEDHTRIRREKTWSLPLSAGRAPHSVVIDLTVVATMDMDGMRALLQLTRELRGQNMRCSS